VAPSSKTLAEMIGETLREAALLVAVFGWLDRVIQQEPFWGRWAWTVLGSSTVLYTLGVIIERYRAGSES
jgi:hypothetical protein